MFTSAGSGSFFSGFGFFGLSKVGFRVFSGFYFDSIFGFRAFRVSQKPDPTGRVPDLSKTRGRSLTLIITSRCSFALTGAL